MSRSDEDDVTQPSPAAPDVFAGLDETAASGGAPLAGEPATQAPEEAKKSRRGKRERKERKERRPRDESGESWTSKLQKASPFNVMLAVSLAMLVIATLCLVLELWRYGFNVSATL